MGHKSTDTDGGRESQQQKEDATTLQSSAHSVGAALSHGPSVVVAKIAKAKDVVRKSVMAAHPVETFNILRRRGAADLEFGLDGESGGEGDEVGGEPTYGHGELFPLPLSPVVLIPERSYFRYRCRR
jgi:hypothetical protein